MRFFFRSYKHFSLLLLLVTTLLAVPFTLSIFAQQQNDRQRVQVQISEGIDDGSRQDFGDISDPNNPNYMQMNGTLPGYGPQVYCPGIGIISGSVCPMQEQQQYQQQNQQQYAPTSQQTTGTTAQSTAGLVNCTVADADFAMSPEEQQMLTILNQYRAQNNLLALPISAALTRAAQWMAKDMISSNNVNGHTDSVGRSYAARIGNCGYSSPTTAVDIVLASSGTTPQAAFSTWTNSGTHKPVILNSVSGITRNWQGVGIGKATGGTGGFSERWVVAFGEVNDGGAVPTTTPAPTVTVQPTTPVTTVTPGTTITIAPSTIPAGQGFNISVRIPGVGPNTGIDEIASPSANARIVQVKILEGIEVKSTQSVPLTYDNITGAFKGSLAYTPGLVGLKVRTDNSLWYDAGFGGVVSGQYINVPAFAVVTGDLNQDNILDLQDYNIFVSCYGAKSCSQKQIADVNMDGKVNEVDLNIFYGGLANRQGD